MKHILEKHEQIIKKILIEKGYEVSEVVLVPSSRKEFGDYQFNGIMNIAKELKKNPREIAEEVLEEMKKVSTFENLNIAGPGFINITFTNNSLIDYANELIKDDYFNYETSEKKTIFLDYGGANVAKVLHVGHLRSANIGEALKRLANSLGNKTISDVHLGDWGRPLGLVILEIKKRYPDLCYFDYSYTGDYNVESPITSNDLIDIYPIASNKAKEDEEYLEEARIITRELQNGHIGYNELWKKILEISKEDIKNIYDSLNASFNLWEGESDCYKSIEEMNEYISSLGIAYKSKGAIVIDVKEESDELEMPPFMLIKSNGSASYQTTDLAGIWQRMKKYNPDEIWYIADNRQALHFETVFRAARKTKIVNENTKLEFIGFGTMNGNDGKPFKTRDGDVMTLNELIKIVEAESEKKLLPNIIEERNEIAKTVAISAIKYADLIPYRTTDYIFDPVKFSDLSGKTGPYLLYSTIRMKSLLKKANEENIDFERIGYIDEKMKEIILNLISIKNIVSKSFNSKSLNEIAELLYKLTNSYNSFYSDTRVLSEEDPIKRESYLSLTKIVYDNNLKLLNILGINVPEKM